MKSPSRVLLALVGALTLAGCGGAGNEPLVPDTPLIGTTPRPQVVSTDVQLISSILDAEAAGSSPGSSSGEGGLTSGRVGDGGWPLPRLIPIGQTVPVYLLPNRQDLDTSFWWGPSVRDGTITFIETGLTFSMTLWGSNRMVVAVYTRPQGYVCTIPFSRTYENTVFNEPSITERVTRARADTFCWDAGVVNFTVGTADGWIVKGSLGCFGVNWFPTTGYERTYPTVASGLLKVQKISC